MKIEEVNSINDSLIGPLRDQMEAAANKLGWNFIVGHVDKMKLSGLCAGYARKECEGIGKEKRCKAAYPHIRNGEWYPERPDQTWAYDTSRLRWWRNTNDSFLFQSDDDDDIDTDINGAFHPDFRAQAMMADELFEVMKVNW